MTTQSNDPLASILAEAERNRRADRAASAATTTVSTPATSGDATVDGAGVNPGTVVVLDANGKIPTDLMYPPGGGGGPAQFEFVQAQASSSWTIPHPLDGYPTVVVRFADGVQRWAEVQYPDRDHVVLKFGGARAGAAYLSL